MQGWRPVYNGRMQRTCHRCHAELPADLSVGSSYGSDEEQALFCPRCGAPQILLPEYMRTEVVVPAGAATTGAVPPPRPRLVEWPVVLGCVLPVAILTGVLSVAGLVTPVASLLNVLCVFGASGIALGLYRSRRPVAQIDGSVGLRVGLVTGLMIVAAMGIGLATCGFVERFALHGMAAFDGEMALQFAAVQTKMNETIQAQQQSPDVQKHVLNFLLSPEGRAGMILFYLAVLAGFIVMLTSALGAFAGSLQVRRRALRRGD